MTTVEQYVPAPLLGCASTEEMFRELIARFRIVGTNIDRAIVLAEMLGSLSAIDREYRTVDQHG